MSVKFSPTKKSASRLLLPFLAVGALAFTNPAIAQDDVNSSAAGSEVEDFYEDTLDLIDAAEYLNEACKPVVDPTYYEGFKAILSSTLTALGATDTQVTQFETSAIEGVRESCADQSACWRSVTGLPESATPEDGQKACVDMMINAMKKLGELVPPDKAS